jgi:hypothetical protein
MYTYYVLHALPCQMLDQFRDRHILSALPCYLLEMNALAPADLAQRLTASPGSKERFGTTAEAVLEVAALVAAANEDWDKGTIAAFQKEQEIHQKVWGKLVSLSKSKNLQSLPLGDLPASYTALYALEVMTPEEIKAAKAEGVITATASTRSILDWTKAYRLRDTGIEQEVPLTLVLSEDFTPEQQKDLLEALREAAGFFGAQVIEGKGGIKQAQVKANQRKARASEIEEVLMREIAPLVSAAPENLKTRFGIRTAADLIEAPRQTFTGFFQNLERKVDGAFWTHHGRAYCLRISRDYNMTDSRAERYQFKKRIEDAVDKWGMNIEGFQEMAETILKMYMGR